MQLRVTKLVPRLQHLDFFCHRQRGELIKYYKNNESSLTRSFFAFVDSNTSDHAYDQEYFKNIVGSIFFTN